MGLVPWVHQSGQRDSRGRITRKGDGVCRAVAVEAATVLMRRYRGDCALKRWALRLEAEKGFGKARVALARKLVVLACTLWQRGERFDPERGMAGV
ncbi:MAG: IS110 family transposase [Gammaproteobacteria bacterium]|nr:IS110 family transposase [Gammaproteobacteria bacterium]